MLFLYSYLHRIIAPDQIISLVAVVVIRVFFSFSNRANSSFYHNRGLNNNFVSYKIWIFYEISHFTLNYNLHLYKRCRAFHTFFWLFFALILFNAALCRCKTASMATIHISIVINTTAFVGEFWRNRIKNLIKFDGMVLAISVIRLPNT